MDGDQETAYEAPTETQASADSSQTTGAIFEDISIEFLDSIKALSNSQVLTAGSLGTLNRELMALLWKASQDLDDKGKTNFATQVRNFLLAVPAMVPPGDDNWRDLPLMTHGTAQAVLRLRDTEIRVTILNAAFDASLIYTRMCSGGKLVWTDAGAQIVGPEGAPTYGALANAAISRAIVYGTSGKRKAVSLNSSPIIQTTVVQRYIAALGLKTSVEVVLTHVKNLTSEFDSVNVLDFYKLPPIKVDPPKTLASAYKQLTTIAEEKLCSLKIWAHYENAIKGKQIQYPLADFRTDRAFRDVVGDFCKDSLHKHAPLGNAISTVRKWLTPVSVLANAGFPCYAVGHSKSNRWAKLLKLYGVTLSTTALEDTTKITTITDNHTTNNVVPLPRMASTIQRKTSVDAHTSKVSAPDEDLELIPKKENKDQPEHADSVALGDEEQPVPRESDELVDDEGDEDDLIQSFSSSEGKAKYYDLLEPEQRTAFMALKTVQKKLQSKQLINDVIAILSDAYIPPAAYAGGEVSSGIYTEDSWSWASQVPLYKSYAALLKQGAVLCVKLHPQQTSVKSSGGVKAGEPSYLWMVSAFPNASFRPFFDSRPHNGEMIVLLMATALKTQLLSHADKAVKELAATLRPVDSTNCATFTRIVTYRMLLGNAIRNLGLTYGLPHLGCADQKDYLAEFLVNDNTTQHITSSEYQEVSAAEADQALQEIREKKQKKKDENSKSKKPGPSTSLSQEPGYSSLMYRKK